MHNADNPQANKNFGVSECGAASSYFKHTKKHFFCVILSRSVIFQSITNT